MSDNLVAEFIRAKDEALAEVKAAVLSDVDRAKELAAQASTSSCRAKGYVDQLQQLRVDVSDADGPVELLFLVSNYLRIADESATSCDQAAKLAAQAAVMAEMRQRFPSIINSFTLDDAKRSDANAFDYLSRARIALEQAQDAVSARGIKVGSDGDR